MNILGTAAQGNLIALTRTDPNHVAPADQLLRETGTGSFEGLLLKALNGANALEVEASNLGRQMVLDPDSVDVHDVTIAMSQANLAVSITKAVVDGALDAYNSIVNMR